MKYLLALSILFLFSCKKSEINLTPLASLSVTNAITGGTTAKLGSYATTIASAGYTQFGLLTGTNPIYVYPSTDSIHPYYNSTLTANQGEVYSLFLAGTPAAVDAIVVKETIPYRTDSTAGIRFINLASNSPALNVTLSTSTSVNEVAGLTYKSMTDFKTYAGLYNSAYTFQVRDPAALLTATPLATISFTAATVPRFANITLVIKGSYPALSILRVNNDR